MIIYKLDSKGKLRCIKAHTEGNELIQLSGLLDGKLVENRKVCTPKNIGKSNETSGEEQAILQLESFIKGKLRKGYYETIEDAQNIVIKLPMKAEQYNKHFKKINWKTDTIFVQPKLDGQRAITDIVNGQASLLSRGGKDINTMMHIQNDLSFLDYNITLDGELYTHGNMFEDIMSSIKKYRKGISEQVKLSVYDIMGKGSFEERFVKFFGEDVLGQQLVGNVKGMPDSIHIVYTKRIHSEEELIQMHDYFVSEGFEGTIIRWGEEEYKIDGRSQHVLKYKDFIDRTAVILDVVPSEARPEQGLVVCRFNELDEATGKEINMVDTFRASFRGTVAQKEYLLAHKDEYIGKTAEIRFQKYSNTGMPTGGMDCAGIRNDK